MAVKRRFVFDPSLVLYLPLYELDGASFASRDAYGHLCTVTGALWTSQGRSFDGVDDFINCGSNSIFNLGDLTILFWINYSVAQASRDIISKWSATGYPFKVGTTSGTGSEIGLELYDGVNNPGVYTGNVRDGNWHCLAFMKRGNLLIACMDGQFVSQETDTATGTTSNTQNVYLGSRQGTSLFFNGILGNLVILRRALTLGEIQDFYLATKWGYR